MECGVWLPSTPASEACFQQHTATQLFPNSCLIKDRILSRTCAAFRRSMEGLCCFGRTYTCTGKNMLRVEKVVYMR